MPDFRSKGGEIRFVDFIDDDHWREVHRAIAAVGIDLDIFRDPTRSKFHAVRAMAAGGAFETGRRSFDDREFDAALKNPSWQEAVKELCAQVSETAEAIDTQTSYGFCNFGLAINNPSHRPAEWTGSGWSWPTPHEDKLLFMEEEHLTEGIRPVGFYPIGSMAVALQYRECI